MSLYSSHSLPLDANAEPLLVITQYDECDWDYASMTSVWTLAPTASCNGCIDATNSNMCSLPKPKHIYQHGHNEFVEQKLMEIRE